MTPSNVDVPKCMASTPRSRKSYESLKRSEILKLFPRFCECRRLSELTPALVTTIGVDATVPTSIQTKPTRPMLLTPLKLHEVRETANYSQLPLHTQPYQEASERLQSLLVSLYHPSSLLTTPLPLKDPLKDIYAAKEPYSGSLQRRLKDQGAGHQPNQVP